MSKKVTHTRVLFHVVLIVLTGGLWLIPLGVRWALSNSK